MTSIVPPSDLIADNSRLKNEQEVFIRTSDRRMPTLDGIQGDCNADGSVNAGDISALIPKIFNSDPILNRNCDANLDDTINAADLSTLVSLIFEYSPPPSNPYPEPNSTPEPYPQPYPEPYPQPYPEPSNPTPPNGLTGVQINNRLGAAFAAKANQANVSWVRYGGMVWSDIEAQQGERDWDLLGPFEDDLRAFVAQGLTPMLIVRGTPEWAQKVEGAFCGPIREEALDDFADFMSEVVTRYSKPPFNVKYWELGNEPDIDPSLIDPMEPFGCWGDQNDEFYGGGYFAQMLKLVYPAIKAADPDAQVILGGLVLDCDPDAPPEGKDCHPSHFLEGVLRAGGGEAFDIVAYHTYPYWHPEVVDSDLAHPNWQHRGGLLLGKADFIRDVMARYNLNKPIMMNEGALLCHPANPLCPNETLFDAQASYLPRLYARASATQLQAAIWYTLNGPGWRHGGLLDESQEARPAYRALSLMGQLLQRASYESVLSSGALEGYAFTDAQKTYHIYWSNDGLTHPVSIPAGTQAVYSRFGERLPFGETISVGVEPIYVEIIK